MSFWVRSSLAGTYNLWLSSRDSTTYYYAHPFTLVADTWTKVVKSIPGESNMTIDNDTGDGMLVHVVPWYGTYYTTSGHTNNAWTSATSTDRVTDYAQNWANTSNATFDLTGVQMEVGESATPYEHCSYGDSLRRCQRYCFVVKGNDEDSLFSGYATDSATFYWIVNFPTPMRAYPTYTGSSTNGRFSAANTGADFNWSSNVFTFSNATTPNPSSMWFGVDSSGITGGQGGRVVPQNAECTLIYTAEI